MDDKQTEAKPPVVPLLERFALLETNLLRAINKNHRQESKRALRLAGCLMQIIGKAIASDEAAALFTDNESP